MKKHSGFTKVILALVCAVVATMSFAGCTAKKGSVNQGSASLFVKQAKGYIGDPMPYFDGEKMNVFYLHQSGRAGPFHPWYLLQTKDFYNWDDKGEAIPTVASVSDVTEPDYALGTGSVVQDKDGLYHAFYTGWNGYGHLPYTEKIQHATSVDLENWTKHPEDGFYGGLNDFRDPYVRYMEEDNSYWMLITSRSNNKGVIKLYKSTDLKTWVYDSVFFENDAGTWNMECPTLIRFKGYWYLTYSQQAPDGSIDRVMRYRYKKELSDKWIIPSVDYVDGAGFYAGRLESYHDDRLLGFGWLGTKVNDYDEGEFYWGGNLVVHEMYQHEDGTLYAAPRKELNNQLKKEVSYKELRSQNTSKAKKGFAFDGIAEGSYLFEPLEKKNTRMTFKINGAEKGKLALTFAVDEDDSNALGNLNVILDFDTLTASYVNAPLSETKNPQTKVNFTRQTSYDCTVLFQNDCMTLYLNGNVALSTRMYKMPENAFGFVSKGCKASVSEIKFFE